MKPGWLLGFLTTELLIGCARAPDRGRSDGTEAAPQELASRLRAVEDLEQGVVRARASGADVQAGYENAARAFEESSNFLERARGSFDRASESYREAEAAYDQAARNWTYYQALVAAAAAVDAGNLERFRAATGAQHLTTLNCDTVMSTSKYRQILTLAGETLAGKDIDHIVPRSLGGADHPANYQVLSSSENRSLGNHWGPDKCAAVGQRCAGAVAISRKCGTFRGTGP